MHEAAPSPHLVPFDGSFRIDAASTRPPAGAPNGDSCRARLDGAVEQLDELQRVLYADNRYALLLVFQAMDAAGKDGTIRAVMSGVDPTGCQVYSFKQPSAEELDHEFLWRTAVRLPERGRIGIFNRSYYEEVLVVRVHPGFLDAQRLPRGTDLDRLWRERFESIRDHELHLARNGTVIIKFWLNVSRKEQKKRFLGRIEEPEKNWKFAAGDVRERVYWNDYMRAYQDALRETSRPWAPWYAVPADSKPYMRMAVAETIADTLRSLGLTYPDVDGNARARMAEMRAMLEAEESSA
jgi:PPK2 family polyphosphate:nucleotide phosphotransferase